VSGIVDIACVPRADERIAAAKHVRGEARAHEVSRWRRETFGSISELRLGRSGVGGHS
jgi:hypothetical protein